MIPELVDGHLPPGRYRVSLQQVRDRFVTHEQFAASTSRSRLFGGLLDYIDAWGSVHEKVAATTPILKSLWIGGSFTTDKADPGDIDTSPIIDGVAANRVAGRPGSGALRQLVGDRDWVKRRYGVEVFPIRWHPIEHPFESGATSLSGDEAAYLTDRGKLDDWWQRCRVNGEDVPTVASCETRRGYLEVVV